MDFKKCSETNNNKVISTSENHKTFRIKNINSRKIRKVEVDGCLISDDRKRCDYLFEIDKPITKVIYLELKGKNINRAYEQLEATIGYLKKRHEAVKKEAYIIASRVPKNRTTTRPLKVNMQKACNVKLFVHTVKTEIEV